MKRTQSWIISWLIGVQISVSALIGITCFVCPLQAADLSFEAVAELGSSYIWRGIEFDSELSFQPNLTFAYALSDRTSVSINGWWNIALTDHDSSVWKDLYYEQDFTIDIDHEFTDRVSLSGGMIYYSAPKSDIEPGSDAYQTDEVFVSTDFSFGAGSLVSTLYYDFDLFDAFYFDLTVSYELSSREGLSLEPAIHLGFTDADDAWYLDKGLVDAKVSFTGSYDLSDHFFVGGSLNYSRRLDGFKDETGGDDSYLWAMASIGFAY